MDTNQIGCLAEYKFATKAMEQGYYVSFPLLNSSPYDCIVQTPKGLFKIQIKSVQEHRPRQRVHLRDNAGKSYTKKDVDYFAIYSQLKKGFFIFKNKDVPKSLEISSKKYLKFFNNFEIV